MNTEGRERRGTRIKVAAATTEAPLFQYWENGDEYGDNHLLLLPRTAAAGQYRTMTEVRSRFCMCKRE